MPTLHSVLVPSADTASRRLIVVLHGLGDSLRGWEWLPDELRLPWLNTLLVNAPDDYHGGFSWYDLYGDPGVGIRRSRALIHDLLDNTRASGFPSDQTVLLGFSQGCVMTLDAGLRYGESLAGLVGISGYVFDQEALVKELKPHARAVPILVTHGTRDPLLDIAPSREQIGFLQQAGLNVTWREYPKEHTVDFSRELPDLRQFLNACLSGKAGNSTAPVGRTSD
ncbi:MAG: serine esterase [Pedosphaera sp.]|nr:serine esterase [Pedosphaera sp.]